MPLKDGLGGENWFFDIYLPTTYLPTYLPTYFRTFSFFHMALLLLSSRVSFKDFFDVTKVAII
jgi:hypothetical protein